MFNIQKAKWIAPKPIPEEKTLTDRDQLIEGVLKLKYLGLWFDPVASTQTMAHERLQSAAKASYKLMQ